MTRKANILFVDDEKRVLNSMRGLFRRDYQLFLTTEGASAVQIVTENPIDVVVADQRMPGMNGTEVLGKIKQLSPRTVRILLTGYADPAAVEGSINIGEVFRFLSKPCPPKMLRETLEMAIAAARTERATPPAAAARSRPAAEPATPAAPAPRAAPSAPVAPAERVAPASTATPAAPVPPATAKPVAVPAARAPVPPSNVRKIPPPDAPPDASSSHWQSVTEVVLSGETSQEIRKLDIEPGQTGPVKILRHVGAVFFTIDSMLAEMAIRTISKDREAILATSLAKVVEVIEHSKVGVLVIDFAGNQAVLKKMISALKSRLPDLVTIVISGNRDTTDMIGLINHGRVYRYLLKPIDPEALRIAVNAAAAHHEYLRTNPELAKRQEAVNKPAETDNPETLNQFFRRLRSIPGRNVEPTNS